ncbi:MAG: hypothetical protein ACOYW7_04905 [Nitrospirota bacterium]
MKTCLGSILCFGLYLCLAAPLALAGHAPGSGIRGTAHDLSSAGRNKSFWGAGVIADPELDRVCVYCHAPHNTVKIDEDEASGGFPYLPLWNHELSPYTVYLMYSSGGDQDSGQPFDTTSTFGVSHRFNAADIESRNQPGSVSRLCLSCHDGSVAISAYGRYRRVFSSPPSNVTIISSGNGRFGIGVSGDLRNHHPIGFDYTGVQATDNELADVNTPVSSSKTVVDLLWNGRVECPTCHDVHNTQCEGEKFLWKSDRQSRFCTTCHLKG